MYFVVLNGIHYPTNVDLKTAVEFVEYKIRQANNYKKTWTAFVVDSETFEIVHELKTR